MPQKKRDDIPWLDVPQNASLRQIYAKYRQEFTAADLQEYTELEEGIPVEEILRELEEIQRQASRKPKGKT
jgi:hypothetical protein